MAISQATRGGFPSPQDEQLCALAQSGNTQAEELLAARYYRSVRRLARPFFLAGGDSDDLIQEGMIGLIFAIREFDRKRAASFRTFAETCIRNRLYSAVRAAARDKHSPLNQSVPLPDCFASASSALSQANPEDVIIGREGMRDALRGFRKQLSDFEAAVLHYYLEGLTTHEIAQAVGRSFKSVDNAVQRVRRKAARYLTSGDFSPG